MKTLVFIALGLSLNNNTFSSQTNESIVPKLLFCKTIACDALSKEKMEIDNGCPWGLQVKSDTKNFIKFTASDLSGDCVFSITVNKKNTAKINSECE